MIFLSQLLLIELARDIDLNFSKIFGFTYSFELLDVFKFTKIGFFFKFSILMSRKAFLYN